MKDIIELFQEQDVKEIVTTLTNSASTKTDYEELDTSLEKQTEAFNLSTKVGVEINKLRRNGELNLDDDKVIQTSFQIPQVIAHRVGNINIQNTPVRYLSSILNNPTSNLAKISLRMRSLCGDKVKGIKTRVRNNKVAKSDREVTIVFTGLNEYNAEALELDMSIKECVKNICLHDTYKKAIEESSLEEVKKIHLENEFYYTLKQEIYNTKGAVIDKDAALAMLEKNAHFTPISERTADLSVYATLAAFDRPDQDYDGIYASDLLSGSENKSYKVVNLGDYRVITRKYPSLMQPMKFPINVESEEMINKILDEIRIIDIALGLSISIDDINVIEEKSMSFNEEKLLEKLRNIKAALELIPESSSYYTESLLKLNIVDRKNVSERVMNTLKTIDNDEIKTRVASSLRNNNLV